MFLSTDIGSHNVQSNPSQKSRDQWDFLSPGPLHLQSLDNDNSFCFLTDFQIFCKKGRFLITPLPAFTYTHIISFGMTALVIIPMTSLVPIQSRPSAHSQSKLSQMQNWSYCPPVLLSFTTSPVLSIQNHKLLCPTYKTVCELAPAYFILTHLSPLPSPVYMSGILNHCIWSFK